MNLFNVTNNISINLEKVRAIERTLDNETRVYIDLGEIQFVTSPIPFETFRDILKSRADSADQMKRDIRQLALYQAIPTP